jgi:predicted MFS family arabinose efflux permease
MPSSPAQKPEVSAENSLRYRGWRIALVAHVGVLTGFAAVFIYSFTLMVKPLAQEFGWNREQISRCFTIAALSVAVCSPFMGRLLDRFEPRKLIAGCMAALGLGLAAMAYLTPHLPQLYLTAVWIGVAGSGTYQLGYARIIATWFERRLGAALSILVAGSSFGSLLIPPLVGYAIVHYGWRHTYLLLALLPLGIGAPLTLMFARSARRGSVPTDSARTNPAASGKTWREAVMTRGFWLIALGVCSMSFSENGALAHLAPMLTDRTVSLADAALVTSILGGSGLAGRLLLGWLLDYLEGAHIAVLSLLSAGGGIYLLAHAFTFRTAAIAALVAGLGLGCELDLIPYMLRRYYGLRAFSALYGSVYSIFAVAGGFAPLIVGHIFDATGSYTSVLSVFSAFTVLAAFTMFALPRYVRAGSQAARASATADEQNSLAAVPQSGGALEGN